MGIVTKTIGSRILGNEMNPAVYCPDAYRSKALPVLYFLHGRTGNESLLQRLEMDRTADLMITAGKIKPFLPAAINNQLPLRKESLLSACMCRYLLV